MSTNDEMVRLYQYHPPEDLRVFTFPPPSVLRLDGEVVVIEEAIGDGIVLRHYAFFDRWFTVTTTTDRFGSLVETPATDRVPAFAFNCDISTPIRRVGNAISTVDL